MAATVQRLLARYRHASAPGRFRLASIDPAETPFSSGDEETDKATVKALAVQLDELQDRLHAGRRHRLLVVLQGMDASGKDGTVRHVFGRMSPLGVRCVGWRAPTDQERAHDPLWRIHAAVPGDGEVVVFNRSHYEDAIVPVVRGTLGGKALAQRLAQFNDFERMLVETGTVVCKFMLHLSKDEQRRRLQARLDAPAKRWKFDPADLQARRQWDAHQAAYAAAIRATGTRWAPWFVVPADSKTHRNLMIATVLEQTLRGLDLRYPSGDAALTRKRVR